MRRPGGRDLLPPPGGCFVMGVLNVTPDSFSDGGLHAEPGPAVARALAMAAEGADLIDIGGESTRPGATPVPVEEELRRVVPVVRALRAESDIPIAVDTSRPEVIEAALAAGADMINDVRALRVPGALRAVADAEVPVCLMHSGGEPATMQDDPRYDDVVAEVEAFLRERIESCVAAGIPRELLIIDPGFGFGKTLGHNLALLADLARLAAIGPPVLVGLSRKSMIGTITGRAVHDRLAGSLALALEARRRGARILRVHDVAPTVDAIRIAAAVEAAAAEGERIR